MIQQGAAIDASAVELRGIDVETLGVGEMTASLKGADGLVIAVGFVPGNPFKMTAAKLRLAMAAMGQSETKVGDLCQELGVTRQTLYRHVSPKGELRPDGEKLLSRI